MSLTTTSPASLVRNHVSWIADELGSLNRTLSSVKSPDQNIPRKLANILTTDCFPAAYKFLPEQRGWLRLFRDNAARMLAISNIAQLSGWFICVQDPPVWKDTETVTLAGIAPTHGLCVIKISFELEDTSLGRYAPTRANLLLPPDNTEVAWTEFAQTHLGTPLEVARFCQQLLANMVSHEDLSHAACIPIVLQARGLLQSTTELVNNLSQHP